VNGGFSAVAYGNGQFVAAAESGGIATSTNGMDWVGHDLGNGPFRSVAYGEGRFVAVRTGGSCCPTLFRFISTSPDGITWTENPQSFPYDNGSRVTYGNGLFVMIGSSPTLLASPDGVNWSSRWPGATNQLWGIVYGNGRFVTVGGQGTILESDSIIRLGLPGQGHTGSLHLSLTGPTGIHYSIERSTDLTFWETVTNLTLAQSTTVVIDPLLPISEHVFYRAHSQ